MEAMNDFLQALGRSGLQPDKSLIQPDLVGLSPPYKMLVSPWCFASKDFGGLY